MECTVKSLAKGVTCGGSLTGDLEVPHQTEEAMSKPDNPSDERYGRLFEHGREITLQTVLFHAAAAARLGVTPTDQKCLELIMRAGRDGPVTAGRVAELTGLSTGAITGVLDRLERGRFIRRDKHPTDRRQVVVRVIPDRAIELDAIFGPFSRRWTETAAQFSNAELAVIARFQLVAIKMLRGEVARLQSEAHPSADDTDSVVFAARGKLEGATLEMPRGAAHLKLRAADDPTALYRAQGSRDTFSIVAIRSRVSLSWPMSLKRLVGLGRSDVALELGTELAWKIEARGGLYECVFDLAGLRTSGVQISGGGKDVKIDLPWPRGTTPVVIAGGVHQVSVTRPAGAAMRVSITGGGANELTIDTLALGSLGGKVRWETPAWDREGDRYDVEIRGGANRLIIAQRKA